MLKWSANILIVLFLLLFMIKSNVWTIIRNVVQPFSVPFCTYNRNSELLLFRRLKLLQNSISYRLLLFGFQVLTSFWATSRRSNLILTNTVCFFEVSRRNNKLICVFHALFCIGFSINNYLRITETLYVNLTVAF